MHSHFSKPLSFFATVEDDEAFRQSKMPKISHYDAVVVGAGLAGLKTADDLCQEGKNVLVIELRAKKSFAIRPQLIFVAPETVGYLDSHGTANIPKKQLHIGIKNLQRLLIGQINQKFCTFLYESKVSEINVNEGSLLVINVHNPAQQEKIFFKSLAITDGGHQTTAKLLEPYFTYHPLQDRPQKYHVMAYLTVTPKKTKSMIVPAWALGSIVHDDRYGLIYHASTQNEVEKIKFSVVMHISENVAKKFETDRLAGVEYLKECLATVFNQEDYVISIPKSKKSGVEKDKLKYSVFCLTFMGANIPAVLINGRLYALGGDALRNADFYQGHGGNDAIFYGLQIALLFNGHITLDDFNKICTIRSEQVSRGTLQSQSVGSDFGKIVVGRLQQASFEKATPMGETSPRNHCDKSRSGNLRMFSFEPDGFIAEPDDGIYLNNVQLRK